MLVAPLVLIAIIGTVIWTIGDSLLWIHYLAQEAYSVGFWPTDEENAYYTELASFWPVGFALFLSLVFLVGGAIASRLAPQQRQPGGPSHH